MTKSTPSQTRAQDSFNRCQTAASLVTTSLQENARPVPPGAVQVNVASVLVVTNATGITTLTAMEFASHALITVTTVTLLMDVVVVIPATI